jgi:hypothetical protein
VAKTIQIRNVPDALHRTPKERAAQAGMTLSEIGRVAKKPTMKEWLEKVAIREPVEVSEPPAVIPRRTRDAEDPRDIG